MKSSFNFPIKAHDEDPNAPDPILVELLEDFVKAFRETNDEQALVLMRAKSFLNGLKKNAN